MRWLLLIGVCMAFGCAAEPQREGPERSTDRRVREWLARGGYRVYVSNHGTPLRFDFHAWIEEGRKIPDAEPLLLRMLSEGDGSVELPIVAGALGALRSAENVPVLIDALRRPDRSLRTQAADALGQLRDARAVEPLGTVLAGDDDQGVRTVALLALWEIGDERALRYLKQATTDKDPTVSEYAEYLLASCKK